MIKDISISLFKYKGIRITFIIVCGLFISEHCFSGKRWDREDFLINRYGDYILLVMPFIYYNFGADNEHAYLQRCTFEFSTDGENYKTLAKCEAHDQVLGPASFVKMTDKLKDAKIYFYTTNSLDIRYLWGESQDLWFNVGTHNEKGFIILEWKVGPVAKILDIRLTGKWHINGLYCPDYIEGEIFKVPVKKPLISDETITKPKDLNGQGADQRRNDSVKISKHSDTVIITGTELGENINVYTTSGLKIKETIANDNVVKILLPANEIYILKIGQERYKVAL